MFHTEWMRRRRGRTMRGGNRRLAEEKCVGAGLCMREPRWMMCYCGGGEVEGEWMALAAGDSHM